MAVESKYANNPALIDQNCQGVCKERDNELAKILSSDQYSTYYASRNEYYKADKDFAAKIGATPSATVKKGATSLPIGNDRVVTKGSKQAIIRPDDSK